MITNPKLKLSVSVKNKRKIFFSGDCFSLSSNNESGDFDILPQHANFISLIKNHIVINKGAKEEKKFIIGNGILIAKCNEVNVFLD